MAPQDEFRHSAVKGFEGEWSIDDSRYHPPHGGDAARARRLRGSHRDRRLRRRLSKIADHAPQIIFVDIMMPRLDGYQTCALIKNNQTFKSVPVIMLSSKDGLFDKARGRIVGFRAIPDQAVHAGKN